MRAICDEFDVLLISDETICGWGRLGEWFGATRYGFTPDYHDREGHHQRLRAARRGDRVRPDRGGVRRRGLHARLTWSGHPVCAAIALANIDALEREGVLEHVRANEPLLERTLRELADIPIVGDVRGAGYFWALELVRDKATKATFSAAQAEALLRDFLSPGSTATG